MFACWFQLGLISQPTVFSSHTKPASAGLINPETDHRRAGCVYTVHSMHRWIKDESGVRHLLLAILSPSLTQVRLSVCVQCTGQARETYRVFVLDVSLLGFALMCRRYHRSNKAAGLCERSCRTIRSLTKACVRARGTRISASVFSIHLKIEQDNYYLNYLLLADHSNSLVASIPLVNQKIIFLLTQ